MTGVRISFSGHEKNNCSIKSMKVDIVSYYVTRIISQKNRNHIDLYYGF